MTKSRNVSPLMSVFPAIGQGALGIEGREDDDFVRNLVSGLEHQPTRVTVTAERALLKRLEGGCQVPIAGHAVLQGGSLTLDGLVVSLDGKRYVRYLLSGSMSDAESIGTNVAEGLLDRGAQPILAGNLRGGITKWDIPSKEHMSILLVPVQAIQNC